jgi:hypothetical protein
VRPSITIDSAGASGQGASGTRASTPDSARPAIVASRSACRSIRSATSAGRLQAASSARALAAPSSSHHIRASQSGAEWATAASSGVESSAEQPRGQPVTLADGAAQDRV